MRFFDMKTMKSGVKILSLVLLMFALLSISGIATAAVMNDYCIVPPFIQEIAKPNLLMIIDNSASMYDMAYDDKGKRYCSTTTAQVCSVNTDCPSGETCINARNPTYCYDETFNNAINYAGYFDIGDTVTPAKNYQFNFATSRFQETTDPIPTTCAMASATGVFCKQIPGVLHLNVDTTNTTRPKYFYASAQFLNWLVSSKFDVEKDVLTGGKYVTGVCSNDNNKSCLAATVADDCPGNTCNTISAFLQPESRGCVGMGYIKNVNTTSFVNYGAADTNPNTPLELTFLVKGPQNPFNPVAPSTGGQTYLEIYSKAGSTYDYSACQKAITTISTSDNQADLKQDIGACLSSSGTAFGTCQQNSSLICSSSFGPATPNCDKSPVSPNPHCTTDSKRSCTADTDCKIPGALTCTAGKLGVVCADNANCDLKTCSANSAKTCGGDANCVNAKEIMGSCSLKPQTHAAPTTTASVGGEY